ncbi:MAG: hypothetical protein QOI06_2251 [Nocardioidaceae bacterium]|nr:hypothetical protein [Nocardioidaceae bacterium]
MRDRPQAVPEAGLAEQLRQLSELHSPGALNDGEFEAAKAHLLKVWWSPETGWQGPRHAARSPARPIRKLVSRVTINLIFIGIGLWCAIAAAITSIIFLKLDPRRWAPAYSQNLHDRVAMEDYFERFAVAQKRIRRRMLIVLPSIFITIGTVLGLIVHRGAGVVTI